MSPHVYRCADLFAGIGGMRLGLEEAFGARAQTVFVSEKDKFARKTYLENFGSDLEIDPDITLARSSEIPPLDILTAGFPCQPFSTDGRRGGLEDARGTLFFDVARILGSHQPRVALLENVIGLLSHDGGRTFGIIRETLQRVGYHVFCSVLNSRDFGVPQNRPRVFIVAFRRDIDSSSFAFPKATDSTRTLADVLEPEASEHLFLSQAYVDWALGYGAQQKAIGTNFRSRQVTRECVASCLTTTRDAKRQMFRDESGISTKNRQMFRRLSVRELARLQAFPDSFEIPVSETQAIKQFGNAVTVSVVAAIGKQIRDVLEARSGFSLELVA